MSQPNSSMHHSAGVDRSVACVIACGGLDNIDLPNSFYFGYWYSHWRA